MQITNNLYILGTSSLGMTKVPVKISNELELYSYFGTEGTLIDAYRKLSDVTNYPNVYLVKISGTHSNVDINVRSGRDIIFRGMSITSIYSSNVGDIRVIFTDNFMQVLFNGTVIEYSFDIYNTTHSLIQKVNQDAAKLICPVKLTNNTLEEYAYPSISLTSCNPSIISLPIADNGMYDTKLQNYFDIVQTLDILKGSDIDYLIFADCYIDDEIESNFPGDVLYNKSSMYGRNSYENESISYYDAMLNFCLEQYKYNLITKGIMGFSPMRSDRDTAYYENVCSSIYSTNNKYSVADKYLSLVSVTCGDVYYDNGGAIDNHYIAYAGVMASEQYDKNISNIDYGENISLRYFLDNDKAKLFSSMNFIIPRHSYLTNNTHIVNAVNQSSGLLANEFVIRVLQYSSKIIKTNLDSYLGEPITNSLLKQMNVTIKDTFDDILSNTCVTNYNYKINNVEDKIDILCELFFPGYINPIKFIV